MEEVVALLIPIVIPVCIYVVLPVMIVHLVTRARQNETNKKTEIMLKAIEAGASIDADFFKDKNSPRTIKERLLKRLIWGCIAGLAALGIVQWVNWDGTTSNDSFVIPLIFAGIFLSVGIALFIGFCVGKKMLAKEIEAEEKALEQK